MAAEKSEKYRIPRVLRCWGHQHLERPRQGTMSLRRVPYVQARECWIQSSKTHTCMHKHTHIHTHHLLRTTKLAEVHSLRKRKIDWIRTRLIIQPTDDTWTFRWGDPACFILFSYLYLLRRMQLGKKVQAVGEAVLEPEHTIPLLIQAIIVQKRAILNWIWCWNFKTN